MMVDTCYFEICLRNSYWKDGNEHSMLFLKVETGTWHPLGVDKHRTECSDDYSQFYEGGNSSIHVSYSRGSY